MALPTSGQIVGAFSDLELDEEASFYLRYHARRYRVLLGHLDGAVEGIEAPAILDVAPMFQTRLIQRRYPRATIDTMGFSHFMFGPSQGGRHIELDLNQCDRPDQVPQPEASHDVAVMAELIEHLYTAPDLVLRYVGGWLRPGGTLIVQTPNAIALHKRVRMLAGRNPIDPIPHSRLASGHFHEYTPRELEEAARQAGLESLSCDGANYFGDSRGARAYGVAARLMPLSLRHGLTLIARRD